MLASRTQGGGLTQGMSFFLPLGTSLVPVSSAGSSTPTFTRATTATVTDWENIVRPVLSGEVRFQGARRVRNLLAFSNDFTNAAWTTTNSVITAGQADPFGGTSATRVVGTGAWVVTQSLTLTGSAWTTSIWVKSNNGATQSINLRNAAVSVPITVTTSWQRFAATRSGASGTFESGLISAGANCDLLIYQIQTEDVTGQSNTNASEFVSTGVLSAPYQGANFDGVQYFPYQNGNTVSNNVVTAGTGAAIGSTTLLGYLAEGARTNLCLQSQDQTNASWTKTSLTVTTLVTAPDGTTTANKCVPAAAASAHDTVQAFSKAASALAYSFTAWGKADGYNFLALRADDNAGNGAFACFNVSTGAVSTAATGIGVAFTALATTIKAYSNGWYRCELQFTSNTAVALNAIAGFLNATGDPTTSFTGDGTSAVDFWGAQLEQASFASSYIPTTTVAVTRNADVLTYASSGNASVLAGSVYLEAQSFNGSAVTESYLDINDGSTNNRILLRRTITPSARVDVFSGGVSQAAEVVGTPVAGTVSKWAASWNTNYAKMFFNSSASAGDTVVTVPAAFTTIEIGVDQAASQPSFATIRNVRIWTIQLADTQLQGITT